MKLYLDEDIAAALLTKRLRQAGHDVQVPADVRMSGESDPLQLAHAIRQGRTFLSRNYEDFEDLHDLISAAQGHHAGILVVRQDNDPKRDLTEQGIVRALAKLIASGVPIADCYYILNHWR